MGQVIILEGPDGAGKTTLANQLTDRGFRYVHTGKPKEGEDLFQNYVSSLSIACQASHDTVFDRHFLGETIYGPIMRGKSLISDHQVVLLMRLVTGLGARLVICLPHWDMVCNNWGAKTNDYVDTTEKLHAIYKQYACEYIHLSHQGCLKHDYQNDTIPLRFVMDAWPRCPEGVIGSPTARILLVGERVNPRATLWDYPFFTDNGSSRYLQEALDRVNLKEHEIALTNAYTRNGRPRDLHQVFYDGGWLDPRPRVVALGSAAAQRLCFDNVPFKEIPHPQYWKRFHAKQPTRYVEMLRDAINAK